MGAAVIVKLGGDTAFTVSDSVVEFVMLPDTPVMVTVAVPAVAVLLAVKVNVLVPVALLGLNDALTPLGRPEADRLTLPLNPFCGAMVIVLVPLAPCVMVKLLGDADSEKPGVVEGVVSDTLSKVAVARLVVFPLFTPSPISTFGAMVMVCVVPTCAQVTPSADT